jgi:hypothetical protein
MSYGVFERKVRTRFGKDVLNIYHENGKHIARLSGDIRIIGNSIARSVSVMWGSGHSAIAAL